MGLMFSRCSHCKPLGQSGFSILEVIITLAIISILTVLVMFRYGTFNSAVLLKNQAFEVALDLREAQSYAISVRGASNQFREEYGIVFRNTAAVDQTYTFWLDNGGTVPPFYNSGEQVQVFSLDSRFEILDICVDDTTCGVGRIDVSFARPNFDATIRRGGGSIANSAEIIIAPTNDPTVTRSVLITSTGQIAVE